MDGALTTPIYFLYRPGVGLAGSGRIEVAWDDGAIVNKWLQVRVKAANLGMNADDVFYFGNATGECGNTSVNTFVDGTDIAAARDNFNYFTNPLGVTSRYDYSRDKYVNAIDMALSRDNQTNFLTCLQLITPGLPTGAAPIAEPQAVPPPTEGPSPITINIGTIQSCLEKGGPEGPDLRGSAGARCTAGERVQPPGAGSGTGPLPATSRCSRT